MISTEIIRLRKLFDCTDVFPQILQHEGIVVVICHSLGLRAFLRKFLIPKIPIQKFWDFFRHVGHLGYERHHRGPPAEQKMVPSVKCRKMAPPPKPPTKSSNEPSSEDDKQEPGASNQTKARTTRDRAKITAQKRLVSSTPPRSKDIGRSKEILSQQIQ